MNGEKWIHVLGNTWCLNLHVTIPVYFLNQQEVVLLDTGFANLDRADLVALLEEKNLRVRAILGSHSHNDHSGSHAYFQKMHGTEVILHAVEAAIVSDYALMSVAYSPTTEEELQQHYSELLLQADRTFRTEDKTVEISGVSFGLVPLPGHTPGHTGVITPDNVLYVGDAVLTESVLHESKLPSTRNWSADLTSKERLRTMQHPKYILAHSGVHDDISSLIELNIADKLQRAEQIFVWLQEAGPVTLNEAEQLLWNKLNLRSRRFLSQVVFRRNTRCALEFLVQRGLLRKTFQNGTDVFEVAQGGVSS